MKKDNLEPIRHSLSHVMAAAVKEVFPGAKLGIGPTIEDGFYYDFDLSRALVPEDLPKIEEKMREIIGQDISFKKFEKEAKRAEKEELSAGEKYKAELIADLVSDGVKKVTYYEMGGFKDLCAGPHVKSTRELKGAGFKLTKISGAYWRGSEKNKMLQRIYALAFETPKELRRHEKVLLEAEKRDHRKLGSELDLFSIPEEVGGGLVVWHPKGAVLRGEIEDFWKGVHEKSDYQYVQTPHIGDIGLWEKSGHLDFYAENLYSPMEIDDQKYLLKPMNCPFHVAIYKSQLRSYRDLPIRYCELGTVYRYERSGVLYGLTRVRGFTQDDAHIFCRRNQLEAEIVGVLKLVKLVMNVFGFKYRVYLSTKPEKAIGSDKSWREATESLKKALKKTKTEYEIDSGEGVFYGPKIDVKLEDALGRQWQGPTVQVDFNFPQKLDITYIDEKGAKTNPVMVHRTVLGSLERFVGVLVEHYAGHFPLWLAPIQVSVISVGASAKKYSKKVYKELSDGGLRVELKDRNETVGRKVREAELQKIPYMLVIGDKEVVSESVAVRKLHDKKIKTEKLDGFLKKLKKEKEAGRREG